MIITSFLRSVYQLNNPNTVCRSNLDNGPNFISDPQSVYFVKICGLVSKRSLTRIYTTLACGRSKAPLSV